MSPPTIVVCGKCRRLDACVCGVERRHKESCPFRRAVACPVAIECEHGYDVCPTCDPCTCGAGASLPPAVAVRP